MFFNGTQYRSLAWRRAWLVRAVVSIADVMDVIDASIVNLAGPSIRANLSRRETTHAFDLVTDAIKQAGHTLANGNAPHHHSTRKERA